MTTADKETRAKNLARARRRPRHDSASERRADKQHQPLPGQRNLFEEQPKKKADDVGSVDT